MDCLFCKIANKEVKGDIVYEDDKFVAFKDIKPKAPVHLLIVPRKHIESVNKLEEEDKELIGEMFLTAKRIAQKMGVDKTGYRLMFNVGRDSGQLVDHLHLHLIGGKKLE